jgi:hypothetical protein
VCGLFAWLWIFRWLSFGSEYVTIRTSCSNKPLNFSGLKQWVHFSLLLMSIKNVPGTFSCYHVHLSSPSDWGTWNSHHWGQYWLTRNRERQYGDTHTLAFIACIMMPLTWMLF